MIAHFVLALTTFLTLFQTPAASQKRLQDTRMLTAPAMATRGILSDHVRKFPHGDRCIQSAMRIISKETGATFAITARNGQHLGLIQQAQKVHGPAPKTRKGQIEWGIRYWARRYGCPCKAWAHFQRKNWQ